MQFIKIRVRAQRVDSLLRCHESFQQLLPCLLQQDANARAAAQQQALNDALGAATAELSDKALTLKNGLDSGNFPHCPRLIPTAPTASNSLPIRR